MAEIISQAEDALAYPDDPSDQNLGVRAERVEQALRSVLAHLRDIERERDEALAVIDRAKAQAERWFRGVGYRVSGDHETWSQWHEGRCDGADELHDILSTAPADALRAVKAEAWRAAAEFIKPWNYDRPDDWTESARADATSAEALIAEADRIEKGEDHG